MLVAEEVVKAYAKRATKRERARCIRAIKEWPGLTEDEKNVAIMAINYDLVLPKKRKRT